jgi:hypothetical protein
LGLIKWSRRSKRNRWLFGGLIALLVIVVLFVALSVSVAIWPGFGAWSADIMRHVLGARATSAIEGFFLEVADAYHRLASHLGIGKAENPFVDSTTPGGATATTSATGKPTWQPTALQPMGGLQDEGVWFPYLTDSSGQTIAYRTALEPDQKRNFAMAVVVAVDLSRTRLHFVLGYDEPRSKNKFPRPGNIPTNDLYTGEVIAAFNGGFKADNGHFGAMQDGNLALSAKWGLGTIVMYKNGKVNVGEWGTDITESADMQSWRQNGPLLVQNGQVGPQVKTGSTRIWGDVYGGYIAGWRSAVGISEDGGTLYFVMGPGLTIGALAASTIRAGAWDAIELDINRAWTRFDKIAIVDGKLTSEPIMDGYPDDNRLLHEYDRDFFYITLSPSEQPEPNTPL